MIIYGYAKDYYYTGDGTLLVKCRIPNIHGPYNYKEFAGKVPKRYVRDEDLPYYPSVLLPYLPSDGDVVALSSLDNGNEHFLIIGLTGASYTSGATNIGEV